MENKTAIEAQLKRVLASKEFADSENFSELLQHVVTEALDGRHVKEETIALNFYKKPLSSGSRGGDKRSFVRVDMGKLRDRLTSYYLHQGWQDEWLIEIPKNGYVPMFVRRTKGTPAEPSGRTFKLTIVAEAECFNNVEAIRAALCDVAGDPNLRIRGISFGSVTLHIKCRTEGWFRLNEAFQDGELSRRLGYEVTALETDKADIEGMAKALSSLGKPITKLDDPEPRMLEGIPIIGEIAGSNDEPGRPASRKRS